METMQDFGLGKAFQKQQADKKVNWGEKKYTEVSNEKARGNEKCCFSTTEARCFGIYIFLRGAGQIG